MYRIASLTGVAALALLGLAACYQSPDVTVHRPGVYQGNKDPLLALEKTQRQQKRLADRFNLVQMDR